MNIEEKYAYKGLNYLYHRLKKENINEEMMLKILRLDYLSLIIFSELLYKLKDYDAKAIYEIITNLNKKYLKELTKKINIDILINAIKNDTIIYVLCYLNYLETKLDEISYTILLDASMKCKSLDKIHCLIDLASNKEFLFNEYFEYYIERIVDLSDDMMKYMTEFLLNNLSNIYLLKIFNTLVVCKNVEILHYTMNLVDNSVLKDNLYYLNAIMAVCKMKNKELAKNVSDLLSKEELINSNYYDRIIYLLIHTNNEELINEICEYYSSIPKFDYVKYKCLLSDISYERIIKKRNNY